jgi:tetratricopeptide (TPR) repeat protein
MKKIFLSLLVILTASLYSQNIDLDAYKTASGIKNPVLKIDALNKFTVDYPASNFNPRAFMDLANSYFSLHKTDSALIFINKYVTFYPQDGRLNPYNNACYLLVKNKQGLDSAFAWSGRAVQIARSRNIKNMGMYLDTYASVLFELGKKQEALNAETEAIKGHEDDPEYLMNLAVYQDGAGKTRNALKNAAIVILSGDTEYSLDKFNSWLGKVAADNNAKEQLKKEIAEETVNNSLQSLKDEEKFSARSSAAAFYSYMMINLDIAEKWAEESVHSINKNTSIEDQIKFHKNLALVLAAEDKASESLKELKAVSDYVDPWDSGFWLALGNSYEKLNDNKKALDAYISGLYAYEAPSVKAAALNLLPKLNLKEEDLQNLIDKKQKESASFEDGKYKTRNSGKVLLAELFTGAECGPCQGADVAFDELSEFFPRTSLAILEYHVNIPGPDPMTNPDTWSRYVYYGGNFGTPTAIFEGKELITGGGPKFLAANRFNLYKYALSKYENGKPEVNISGKSNKKGDNINFELKLKGNTKDRKNVIHIALVEKFVNYTGSNTIDKHKFVVRNLLDNEKGSVITTNKISGSFDLNKIEGGLTTYLNDPTKHPSWRPSFGAPSWKARTDKLNRGNLAIVAWIQNPDSKEVINAVFIDVKK